VDADEQLLVHEGQTVLVAGVADQAVEQLAGAVPGVQLGQRQPLLHPQHFGQPEIQEDGLVLGQCDLFGRQREVL
jgi:hypothetical protein